MKNKTFELINLSFFSHWRVVTFLVHNLYKGVLVGDGWDG